jgi:hypothetical protein
MTHNEQLREQIQNTLIANACALNHVTGGAAAVKEIPIPGTEHVMLIGSRADVARFLGAGRSAAREQARNEALEEAAKLVTEKGEPGVARAVRALKTEAPAASKEGDNRE